MIGRSLWLTALELQEYLTEAGKSFCSIGGLDFEHRIVDRSSMWGVDGGGQIRTCSAEDLVVLKAFAARDQDWIDVKNVLIRQAAKLDRNLIREELAPLVDLKEEPEILIRLEALFREVNS